MVYLSRGDGTYERCLLGIFNSTESRTEYDRLISDWLSNGRKVATVQKQTLWSVAEVCVAFMKHADGYYRDRDGIPTSELDTYKRTFRRIREPFGEMSGRNSGSEN